MRVRVAALILVLLSLLSAFAAAAEAPPAAAAKPTVVLITLDTFRADRLAAWGGPPSLTPELNALAARGVVYTGCFTPAPVTLPAHATALTGCSPLRTGLVDNGQGTLSPKVPALAESFAAAGYRTGAVVASDVLRSRYGLNRGFQLYDDGVGAVGFRDAADVTDRALRFLKAAPEPAFLWAHYFNTHEPYLAPPEYDRRGTTPYDRAAAYEDAQVGRLLKGLPPGTVVAVISDHGESLGEHREETHGNTLYQAAVKVVCLFASPALAPGKDARLCSLADLAPTLASLAGLRPAAGTDGRDLRLPAEARPRPVPLMTLLPYYLYRWRPLVGVTDGRFKWVRGRADRLFDLAADPGETRDLAASAPEAAVTLQASIPAVPEGPSPAGVDPALRGLGYLPAPGGDPRAAGHLADPEDQLEVLSWMRHAQQLRTAGNLKEAIALYQRAVKTDPGSPSGLFDLGETLRRDGQFQPAIVALDRALAISPRLSAAWVSKGHALLGLTKVEEAATCYRKALELSPDSIDALNPVAAYYLDKNSPGEAFPLLDRALAAGVADTQTYLMLGRIHLIQGKDEEARKDFFSALQLSTDPRSTLKQEADAYMMRQKYEEGVARYAEGIRKFPDFADNYLVLGTWYLQGDKVQADNVEKALTLFRKALDCPMKPEDRARAEAIVRDLEALVAQGPAGATPPEP